MMTNPTGRLTQGQFSFLPDLTDAEITAQIEYGLNKGYAWSVEYTADPHPRNTYWEMFGMPMFDLKDAAGVLGDIPRDRDVLVYCQSGMRSAAVIRALATAGYDPGRLFNLEKGFSAWTGPKA